MWQLLLESITAGRNGVFFGICYLCFYWKSWFSNLLHSFACGMLVWVWYVGHWVMMLRLLVGHKIFYKLEFDYIKAQFPVLGQLSLGKTAPPTFNNPNPNPNPNPNCGSIFLEGNCPYIAGHWVMLLRLLKCQKTFYKLGFDYVKTHFSNCFFN